MKGFIKDEKYLPPAIKGSTELHLLKVFKRIKLTRIEITVHLLNEFLS
jgi:hypothetical protein